MCRQLRGVGGGCWSLRDGWGGGCALYNPSLFPHPPLLHSPPRFLVDSGGGPEMGRVIGQASRRRCWGRGRKVAQSLGKALQGMKRLGCTPHGGSQAHLPLSDSPGFRMSPDRSTEPWVLRIWWRQKWLSIYTTVGLVSSSAF